MAGSLIERGEGRVDPGDDRLDGAEVGGQLHPATAGAEGSGRAQESRDVGPPEPVDGLLGVAHHEQVPGGELDLVPWCRPRRFALGVSGGDPHRQLDLDRVGVLELVQEQALVPVVQAPAHSRLAQ